MVPETDAETAIEVVLFDLSGVLIDFRGARALGELVGFSEELAWERWLISPWMRRFDAGLCSEDEFAEGVVEEWGLAFTPAQFIASFDSWMGGPFPGAQALVSRTRSRVAVGCLSNMNPLHWREIARWELLHALDHRFISCELRRVKPDREIYEHAAAALGVAADRVLFLDDNLLNVEGALACGLQSAHVRGVAEAERALAARGLLDPLPDSRPADGLSRRPRPAGS